MRITRGLSLANWPSSVTVSGDDLPEFTIPSAACLMSMPPSTSPPCSYDTSHGHRRPTTQVQWTRTTDTDGMERIIRAARSHDGRLYPQFCICWRRETFDPPQYRQTPGGYKVSTIHLFPRGNILLSINDGYKTGKSKRLCCINVQPIKWTRIGDCAERTTDHD